jgi:glycosyltransferase involved in cell wall biosynthesis
MSESDFSGTIDVSYCGVHTAFECALAAQEMGVLREFHCSFYDAPGCWGGWASRVLGAERLRNRRTDGLEAQRVKEDPWPWLANAVRHRFGGPAESMEMLTAFDRHYAARLRRSPPTVLVTTERCALESLKAARSAGVRTLHDCPQLHPVALDGLMAEAADRAGVPWHGFADGPAMVERKLEEFALAERLMVYSEFQRDSFISQGVPPECLFVNPLWVDTDFWHPTQSKRVKPSQDPLSLLFVGELSFRKGLPFLFEALKRLDAPVHLTLAGRPTGQFPIPEQLGRARVTAIGPVTKHRLRELYSQSDLMVLPSVADAFGWVAVEAMACGLPVLLTENCGAPVPDPAWRTPAMDSAALAARLQFCLDHPDSLQQSTAQCRAFAAQFIPVHFRERVRQQFEGWLSPTGIAS